MTRLIDALRTVPRVDAATWQRLGWPTRWAVAARASVLQMTFSSAATGGLAVIAHPAFDGWLWLLALFGLLAAHATNNLLNDYIDTARGLDGGDAYRTRYGTQVLVDGLLTRAAMRRYIAATAAIALGIGGLLVELRGGLTLPLLVAGIGFVLFYTWPLKHIGLGEPTVLLVWGPLMSGGAAYVACGEWSAIASWLGLLYGIGPTLVLIGKHIDKRADDAARRVYTLPVLLGDTLARRLALALIALQYAILVVLVLSASAPWAVLLCGLNLPHAWRGAQIFAAATPAHRPADYPAEVWPLWYAHTAFVMSRRFSMLLLAGLLLAALF